MSNTPDEELDPQSFPDVEVIRSISTLGINILDGLLDSQVGRFYADDLPEIIATTCELDNEIIGIERQTSYDQTGILESDELSFIYTKKSDQGMGSTYITIQTTELVDNSDPRHEVVARSLVVETDTDYQVEDPDEQIIIVNNAFTALMKASKNLGAWKPIAPMLDGDDVAFVDLEQDGAVLTYTDFINITKALDHSRSSVEIDPRLQQLFFAFLSSIALYKFGLAGGEYTQSLEDIGKVAAWTFSITGLLGAMKIYFDFKHQIPEQE